MLHAGAGVGLVSFAMLPPALPAKKGVSALVLDLSSTPVCIPKIQQKNTKPEQNEPPTTVAALLSKDRAVIPAPRPFDCAQDRLRSGSFGKLTTVRPEPVEGLRAGIQSPVILDSRFHGNDRGGRNACPERSRRDSQETQKNCPSNADLLEKGVRETEVLGKLQPQYPWLSRKKGEEGEVIVTVRVNAKGGMTDCKIKKSSGFARLDHAALEAVAKAVFSPARRDGMPVESSKDWAFDFRLEEGKPK